MPRAYWDTPSIAGSQPPRQLSEAKLPLTAQPGACRPIDAAARSAHHRLRSPSGSFGAQHRVTLPASVVADFFSEVMRAAASCCTTSDPRRDALDAETGEGKQIDPSMGGDRDSVRLRILAFYPPRREMGRNHPLRGVNHQ